MQVAEQERLLNVWGQVEETGELGHAGSSDAKLPGGVSIARDRAVLDQPLDVVGQGQHPGGAADGTGAGRFACG